MPNVYVRKSNKGSWSEEDLRRATEAIKNDSFSIRAASRQFNIPESTLRNRLRRNTFEKHALGPDSQLGVDAEKKLAHHIKKLQAVGFAPTQHDVRILAYSLAETLGKKHTFNSEKKIAGKVWFASFMRRNADLSVRKAQGISRARTEGMNREEVKNYFNLLTSILTENDLLRKPGCIWNCDEIGLQLNNEPGKVVAAKGSKDVHVITSAEKGETITILGCCNAEGQFLPPYCIFKGVYAKPQYERGAPPGSVVKMRRESAYISSELFMDWMAQHFIPRKPAGKNLLILDGHTSHMNSPDMLQVAADNDVIILCLPSHTTHYLQPLDRVVFKPFKTYFKDACGKLVTARQGTGRISRDDFGELLNSAWSRSANVQLATSAFRATGIYPLNIDAIPEHAYLLSCDVDAQKEITEQSDTASTPSVITPSSPSFPRSTSSHIPMSLKSTPTISEVPSTESFHPSSDILLSCQPSTSTQAELTPTKVLEKSSPIPDSLGPSKAKRKQSATNVTDPEYINKKRKKNEAALKKKKTAKDKKKQGVIVKSRKSKLTKEKKSTGSRRLKFDSPTQSTTSGEESDGIVLLSDHVSETNDDECAECLEPYSVTTSKSDWIKCISCGRWLHETCSVYEQQCTDCGRKEIRQKRRNN